MTTKPIGRRELLKALSPGITLGAVFHTVGRETSLHGASPAEATAGYLESLARPDGGYGWPDQPDSYLSVTFAVVGCYHLLGLVPPRRQELIHCLPKAHPTQGEAAEARRHAADARTLNYQQIQSFLWLGADPEIFRAKVREWAKPSLYATYYESHGYPVFQQEMMIFICRDLLGLGFEGVSTELYDYLDSRRRKNGSFNNTPASDGTDGNILNTWWGLAALKALGRCSERKEEAISWLQSCQLPGGGFTWQPDPQIGRVEDVSYTWAGVKTLHCLGASPANVEVCAEYLRSLWNADGGAAYRPGLPSQPLATYYALDALGILGAKVPKQKRRSSIPASTLPPGLEVFTAQIEAPGQGSPMDAVELARSLKIHLWGAKNADPAWIARARALATSQGVPVIFFRCHEQYGTFLDVPGFGSYSHLVDYMLPAESRLELPHGSHENPVHVPWQEFRERYLDLIERERGRVYWQVCDNGELAQVLLDDSTVRGGYAAISTFHFWIKNFGYSMPFLFRYRHLIPFMALQDAHGEEPWWWADELAGYRTLFLAPELSWEGWLQALEKQWVVAVRHDQFTHHRTRMLGGGPRIQEFTAEREKEWKWWNDSGQILKRPVASVAVLGPGDILEAGKPVEGLAIRVRCWWRTDPQGRPLEPMAELRELLLDGSPLDYRIVEKRRDDDKLSDHYYYAQIPGTSRGTPQLIANIEIKATRKRVEVRKAVQVDSFTAR